MKELQGIITMYQEAFPENPIWQNLGKKDKKQKKQPQVQEQVQVQELPQVPAQPEVDISKVVEDALGVVADAVALSVLNSRFS